MFSKLNPIDIVLAHFRSLHSYDSNKLSITEMFFHILFPAFISAIIFWLVREVSETVVGIIVSAASIAAGLMLNLLVLIYTLVHNTKSRTKQVSNFKEFRQLTSETLATIAYNVFLCIFLIVSAFFILSESYLLSAIGRLVTVYIGVSAILCLLIVLKRCHNIIQFDVDQ